MVRFPWLGTGADHLGLGGYAVGASSLVAGGQRLVIQDPHSLPLLLAGLFGVPALLAFLVLVFVVLREAYRALRLGRDDARPNLGLYSGWVAGFLGLLVASLLSVWTITAIFILFLALAALMAPSLRTIRSRGSSVALATMGLVLVSVSVWGSGVSFAASRQVALSQVDGEPTHVEMAIRLVPWDARTRTDYYWRLIQSSMDSITGTDVATSRTTTDDIDAEVKREVKRFPRDLMFYRLRIDLFAASMGYPGYRRDRLLSAIDEALATFPDDPEFLERRRMAAEGSAVARSLRRCLARSRLR